MDDEEDGHEKHFNLDTNAMALMEKYKTDEKTKTHAITCSSIVYEHEMKKDMFLVGASFMR